jgi:hypothetical protein
VSVFHVGRLEKNGSAYVDIYFSAFPKDRMLLKALVAWIYLIGVAQTIFAVMDLYNTAITILCIRSIAEGVLYNHFWLSVTASSALGEPKARLVQKPVR